MILRVRDLDGIVAGKVHFCSQSASAGRTGRAREGDDGWVSPSSIPLTSSYSQLGVPHSMAASAGVPARLSQRLGAPVRGRSQDPVSDIASRMPYPMSQNRSCAKVSHDREEET